MNSPPPPKPGISILQLAIVVPTAEMTYLLKSATQLAICVSERAQLALRIET